LAAGRDRAWEGSSGECFSAESLERFIQMEGGSVEAVKRWTEEKTILIKFDEQLASGATSAEDLDHPGREASLGDEVADEGGLCGRRLSQLRERGSNQLQLTLTGDFSDDLMMIVLPAATAASLKTKLRACR
jgi:hypothetical protein